MLSSCLRLPLSTQALNVVQGANDLGAALVAGQEGAVRAPSSGRAAVTAATAQCAEVPRRATRATGGATQ